MRPDVRALVARGHLSLAAILAFATALFLYRLGGPSFFLDEVFTLYTVREDVGELETRLVEQEVAPPLYYVILHGWVLLTGAESEAALRFPSVVAGVALVGAVYWLGSLVGGRRAGLLAAGLTAVSPLVLQYAQQARAYVWAMLFVTVAVAAAIEAVRERSTRWLVVAGAVGAAAILTHYTAVLVIGPFAVWLVMRDDTFDLRLRALAAAAMTAPLLALAPLAAEQLSRGHQDWTDQFGRLGVDNTLRLLGTPFDGRYGNFSDVGLQVGAAVVVIAVTILATGERLIGVHNRRMVAACALAPIGAVILTSAVVHPVALTRYSAVAAPFVLVAVGVVAVHVQRELAVVLVGATLALSAIGVVGAERDQGQYPDTRGAVSTVAAHWRDGDVVVGVNLFSFPAALAYYAERKLPPEGRRVYDYPSAAAAFDAPEIVRVTRRRARIWLLADPPLPRPELRYALEGRGYRARREWRFEGPRGVQVVLASRAGR